MSMPSVVSHHIDIYSLLHPPVKNYPMRPNGLILRQVDSATGNRDDFICPICGESYGTHERWVQHVKYQKIVEKQDGYPVEGTHLSIPDELLKSKPDYSPIQNVNRLRDYFQNEISEIVVVVEGIEPLISGTFQALQSYQIQDIVWDADAQFQPCLNVDGSRLKVDLNQFHFISNHHNVCEDNDAMLLPRSLRGHDSVV